MAEIDSQTELQTDSQQNLQTDSIKIPKKRGRKPKNYVADLNAQNAQNLQDTQDTQDPENAPENTGLENEQAKPEVQRKRGRKKKYVIESIKKLKDTYAIDDNIEFDSVSHNLDNLENKTQVSFGSLNITIHKDNPINKHELRKLFDTEFNLEEDEKVPTVLIQEDFDTKKEEKVLKHFKILDTFSEKWPERTDTWCHWCCHPFDNTPVPCPIRYDEITNKFDNTGIFCSWSCAGAYSREKYKSLTNLYLLKKLIEEDNDIFDTESIKIALPKICLKVFGGSMSIEDYRKNAGTNTYIANNYIKQVSQYIIEE